MFICHVSIWMNDKDLTAAERVETDFTARRYASAVYAVVM